MSELPDGARKVIYDYVTKALETAATKYAAVHGKPMDAKLVKFLCVFVTETVDFIWECADNPEKLNAKSIALVVIKRTNATVGLIDESSPQMQTLIDCGVGAVALALTIADTAELEATVGEAVSAATAATGGAAAPGYAANVAIGVMGALYAVYQAYEAFEACEPLLETPEGEAIPQTVEQTFPASDKVPETRAYCIEEAQDLVCSLDHPDPPADGTGDSSSTSGASTSSSPSSDGSNGSQTQSTSTSDGAAQSCQEGDDASSSSSSSSSTDADAPAASPAG